MTDEIDALAGRPTSGRPLTFADLWGPEATAAHRGMEEHPERWFGPEQLRAARDRIVDLEVMTTNLTFRRPYRFPFDQRIWFFCEARMRQYFPGRVVDHLVDTSTPAEYRGAISMRCPCHRERVRSLPAPPDVPVVMAARLSLSFPGLISAVPLLTVDRARAEDKRGLVETWFSDGGIARNFPVHLFDKFWPRRPAFAINLQPLHPDHPQQFFWRAKAGASGIVPRARPMPSMPAFVSAILDTMQNWVDSTQIIQPGHRDRVAEVRLAEREGGINLKMDRKTILRLADRGEDAAAEFDDYDFDLHRWIRYRVEMSELDTLLDGLLDRSGGEDGYEAFVARTGPTTRNYRHDTGRDHPVARADLEATLALLEVARAWRVAGHPASKGSVPRPRPALRIVPKQ
jgi:predicted acylesterase/phospholipase RssA